jgi:large subunit ribosomal protein L13
VKGYKTYVPKASEITPLWWLVDAEGQTLGRLASRVATVLRGKERPGYSPHFDPGDHVVVINAEKVAVTGDKLEAKRYYHHSGYPGGLSERTLAEMLSRHPERAIQFAVRGMLPRNRLRRQLLGHLKVYAGPDHPHQAQRPQVLDVAARMKEHEA